MRFQGSEVALHPPFRRLAPAINVFRDFETSLQRVLFREEPAESEIPDPKPRDVWPAFGPLHKSAQHRHDLTLYDGKKSDFLGLSRPLSASQEFWGPKLHDVPLFSATKAETCSTRASGTQDQNRRARGDNNNPRREKRRAQRSAE